MPPVKAPRPIVTPPPAEPAEVSYTFKFRKILDGNFKGQGLWELTLRHNNGKEKQIITDADLLSNLVDTMSEFMGNAGH